MTHRHGLPTRAAILRLLGVLLIGLAAPLASAQVPTLSATWDAPEPEIQELGFGNSIEPLNDVNDDGTPDFAVGAYTARRDGLREVGRLYIVDGATGAALSTIEAPNNVEFGRFSEYLANLGDVDGDGADDFAASEQGATFNGDDTGAAYVFSGATGAMLYTLVSPSPEANGDFGSDVAPAGDLNNDGIQDLLVGALNENDHPNGSGAGQVHLFSGADGALIRTITRPYEPTGSVFSFFGRRVYLTGDLDADGVRDHAVWTRFQGQGRVDFFSAADGSHIGFIAPSFASGAGEFGQDLLVMPDATGDGVDDLVIAAPQAEIISPFPPRVGRGVIQLYDGATLALVREYRPGAQQGSEPEATGQALALAKDLDGDGTPDFYAGSPGADEAIGFPGVNAGRVYVFSTGSGTVLGQLSSPAPERIGVFGAALATADLSGDGSDELLVGAPREATIHGRVHVFEQNEAAVVADGSFEAGSPNPFWDEFGIPSNPICSVATCGPNEGIEAYEGDWFVFFGRAMDATSGFVEQEVTIPVTANTLSFYLKIPVAETAGNVTARIDGEVLFQATQQDADTYANYQRVDVDVSAYADGGTHTLRFQSATVSANPPGRMFFFIDQVSIVNRTSTAAVALSPDPIPFGQVPVGETVTQEVTLSNPGGDPLVVESVVIEAFAGPPEPITTDAATPFTVEPGESTTFNVTFAPTAPVQSIVNVTVVSNAASSPNKVLAGGAGIVFSDFAVTPGELDFTLPTNTTSAPQTLTLSNGGNVAGTYTVTTTVTPPGAAVPGDLTPADRLRTPSDFVRGEAPSRYERVAGGGAVQDGSFEATTDDDTRDNPFWDEFSAQQGSPFCNAACFNLDLARTGDWYAIFGFDVELGTDYIQQEVELDAGTYDLTFFYAGGTDRDDDGQEEAEGFFRVFYGDEMLYELSAQDAQDFTLDYQQLTITFDVEEASTEMLRIELEQIVADDSEDAFQIILDDVSLAPATLRLVVDPRIGTVAPDGSQEISVSADAFDAEPGTYTAQLRIDTDDPDVPTFTVDVTVEVVPNTAGGSDATPLTYALRPSFPNPVRGASTLGYDLPEASEVRIRVFDATGRHLATLVDAEQGAGRYEVEWDASHLPSGVYVYRIDAGSFSDAQRVVVVR